MRRPRTDRLPRWGIIALFVAVLVNGVLFTSLATRPAAPDSFQSSAAASSLAATQGASPATPAAGASVGPGIDGERSPTALPLLAVYGDGYATGNALGGTGAAGWPALVAAQAGARLELHAESQAGYASTGVNGHKYSDLVAAAPPTGAAVTILFGSRNDVSKAPTLVASDATTTIAAVRSADPTTMIVVVGPVWTSANVPGALMAVRDSVRTAAQRAGATFVDPLTEGWFSEPSGLVAADGISPTDAGHAYLASLIGPGVQRALSAAAAASGD